MKNVSLLQKIGLGKNEANVYLVLLAHGESTIADIARVSGLHRPLVYVALSRLKEKSLWSSLRKGKRLVYSAEHPRQLEASFAQVSDELHEALPGLVEVFEHSSHRPSIRYLTGKQGVTEVYNDLLRTLHKGEVFFRYESPKEYKKQDKYLPRAYFDRVCDKREIQKYVITNERTLCDKPKQLERYVKAVPKSFDVFEYNVSQIIYTDKVAFIDFNSETAWIIENSQFATFQRQIFRLLMERM